MISRVFKAQASGTGKYVDWSKFKQYGEIEERNPVKSSFMTTTIPDILNDLLSFLAEKHIDFQVKTIFPNGFTTTSLDLLIECDDIHILCGRRLVRGFFPFNPFAAEFGKNYDLMFSLSGSEALVEGICEQVITKYKHTEYTSSQ
jgi:hypothetical protein